MHQNSQNVQPKLIEEKKKLHSPIYDNPYLINPQKM